MIRTLLALALLTTAAPAVAQQAEPVFVQAQPQPQAQPVAQEPTRGARQGSLYLLSPVFLSDGGVLIGTDVPWDPGFGIGVGGRFGWEFGMLVPEVHLGIATNLSGTEGISRITHAYLSLGARLQFLNASRFIPFVSAALRGNFWEGRTDADATLDESFTFTPAVVAGGGLAVELTRSFGLEVAVDLIVDFDIDDVFGSAQVLLVPRLGGTVYF